MKIYEILQITEMVYFVNILSTSNSTFHKLF